MCQLLCFIMVGQDGHIGFWLWDDINDKRLFQKFQLIPLLCYKLRIKSRWQDFMQKWLSFHEEWFLLNSFGEMCFLEENYKKKSNFKLFESTL